MPVTLRPKVRWRRKIPLVGRAVVRPGTPGKPPQLAFNPLEGETSMTSMTEPSIFQLPLMYLTLPYLALIHLPLDKIAKVGKVVKRCAETATQSVSHEPSNNCLPGVLGQVM